MITNIDYTTNQSRRFDDVPTLETYLQELFCCNPTVTYDKQSITRNAFCLRIDGSFQYFWNVFSISLRTQLLFDALKIITLLPLPLLRAEIFTVHFTQDYLSGDELSDLAEDVLPQLWSRHTGCPAEDFLSSTWSMAFHVSDGVATVHRLYVSK